MLIIVLGTPFKKSGCIDNLCRWKTFPGTLFSSDSWSVLEFWSEQDLLSRILGIFFIDQIHSSMWSQPTPLTLQAHCVQGGRPPRLCSWHRKCHLPAWHRADLGKKVTFQILASYFFIVWVHLFRSFAISLNIRNLHVQIQVQAQVFLGLRRLISATSSGMKHQGSSVFFAMIMNPDGQEKAWWCRQKTRWESGVLVAISPRSQDGTFLFS
jgi:hypothetical protein